MADPGVEAVAGIRRTTKKLLKSEGRVAALHHAMKASTPLLRHPTDPVRTALRSEVFNLFNNHQVPYQANDFEVVDYHLYEVAEDLPMFRGPPVSAEILARGDYFCVIGAAQTFGRLVRRPWPMKIGRELGLAPVNLSRGGAGPGEFLDPRLLEIAGNARFVILQAMSGRSVGCQDYPGGRRITKDGVPSEVHRWDILEALWNEDREKAICYVQRWNNSYLESYRRLRNAIGRPTLLLWLSSRRPADWSPDLLRRKLNWGEFPQLVGGDLFREVAALFPDHLLHITPEDDEKIHSRFTGKPCPYFGQGKKLHTVNHYYPTQPDNKRLAKVLLPICRRLLEDEATAAASEPMLQDGA
jgi:hypothetical protein